MGGRVIYTHNNYGLSHSSGKRQVVSTTGKAPCSSVQLCQSVKEVKEEDWGEREESSFPFLRFLYLSRPCGLPSSFPARTAVFEIFPVLQVCLLAPDQTRFRPGLILLIATGR